MEQTKKPKTFFGAKVDELLKELKQTKQQRDDLLAALRGLITYHYHNDMGVKPKEYHNAIKAIAKVNHG